MIESNWDFVSTSPSCNMFIALSVAFLSIQRAVSILAVPAPAQASSRFAPFSTTLQDLLANIPSNLTKSVASSQDDSATRLTRHSLASTPNIPANLSLPLKPLPTKSVHNLPTNGTKKIDYKVPKTSITLHVVLHSPGAAEVRYVSPKQLGGNDEKCYLAYQQASFCFPCTQIVELPQRPHKSCEK